MPSPNTQRIHSRGSSPLRSLGLAVLIAAASATPAVAQTITKAGTGTELTTAANWTGGVVPGSTNVAEWSSTSLGTGLTLASSLSWQGINVTGALTDIAISASSATSVLSIGSSGITLAGTRNLTLGSSLAFTANQTWSVEGGRSLVLIAGDRTASGTGNINIVQTGSGAAFVRLNQNGNTANWNNFSGNFTVNANVTLQSEGNAAAAFGTGTIFLNGGQIAQGNGNWTWSNAIDVAAGSVIRNNSSNGLGRLMKLTGNLTSSSGASLTFTNNTTGGTRTQDVGFILAGADASTYGDTIISANSRVRVGSNATNTIAGEGLNAGNRGSLGTGSVTLNASTAELAFTRIDSHTVANAISGAGTVVIGGTTAALTATSSQVVTFTGANTYSGSTTIAAGTLQVGAGGTAGTLGTGGVVNAGSLIFNRSDALTASNVISGAGSVTKTGAGTLTLSGNSSYSGGTTLAQGTLIATNANALGTSGTVTLNNAATGSGNTSLFLNGSLNLSRAITVANQGSGTTTLGSSTLTAGQSSIFSGAISLAKDVTLQGAGGDRTQFSGGISGTGNVTVSGAGRVLFLSAANTYAGGTTLTSNALLQLSDGTVSSTSFIPDASLLTLGSGSIVKLAKGSNNETVGGLAGTGTVRGHEAVASVASSLTVSNAGDYSFGGVLENGGASGSTLSLTKSGSGNQTLTGTNTFTGGTTIGAGTLTLGHATDTLANTGAVSISGGTLALGSNSDTIGALSLTSGAITGTGTLTTSGATFDLASDLSIDVILGGGALTKQGVGALTLTAVNTHTGATTVSAGTLNLASGASLAADSAVSVASGATLTGTGSALGTVTLASGGTLTPGTSNVGTLSLGSLTLDGAATINVPVSIAGTIGSSLAVTGNVTASGAANSVTFALGGNLALLGEGIYSLVTHGGGTLSNFDAFTWSGTAGARQDVALLNTNNVIQLDVGNAFVTWSGAQGSGWSTADNWIVSSTSTADSFLEGDVVVFNDDSAVGGVSLGSNVTAATVTINAATTAYTITSGNGSGFTASSLVKSGAATATLSTANTISGETLVSDGTLVLGDVSALGASNVSLAGGTLDANGLLIANNIALAGGTLASNGATLSGVISESGGARSLAVGSNLTLTGANTYTGGTTISAGTLQVGADGTSGTLGSGAVTNDSALVFSRSNTATFANDISGTGTVANSGSGTVTLSGTISSAGTLTQSGAGTLILTGGNSYGATAISGGTLQVGADGTTGTLGASAVTNDAALVFSRSNTATFANDISGTGTVANSGSGTVTLSGAISSSGTLTQSGNGTLILTGGNSYGATAISTGTLQVGADGTTGTLGSGAVTNDAALVFSRSNTATFANDISGTGTVANAGSGTVTLSGTISSAGTLTQSGAGTLILTGGNSYGATAISGGTLQVGADGTTGTLGTGAVTFSNGAALVFNRSDSFAVANAISGAGSLTKSGNGTLTLSSASTYSGGTTLSAGTIQLGNATALGTAGVTVSSGTTLNVAGFNAANALNLSGSGNGSNPALWNSAGTFTTVGAVTLGADASVGNSTTDKNTTLNLGITNLAGNTLTIASGAVSINTRNFSSGNIVIADGGTLYTDNGTNTYASATGTITINAGGRMETRDTDNTAQTSAHTIALNGGTLSTGVIANNNGGGAGTILRNAITVDATNGGSLVGNNTSFAQNLRLTGAITGSGALAISGAQGVELRGDLSGYTGTATVTEGTLTLNPSTNTTFGGTLAGARPIVKSGANTLTFGSVQSYTGATTVSAGTLALSGAGDISASSSVNLSVTGASLSIASASGGRTVSNLAGVSGTTLALGSNVLTVSSGSNSTFSGVISGTAGLVKSGVSQLSLAGASTFSGGVTLNAGTLDFQVNSVAGTSGALGTGTLTVNAGTLTTQGLERALANNILLNADLTVTGTAGSQGMRLNGVISGDGGIIKSGTGRVSLANNSNSFTGAATLNAGILAIGNGSLSSASAVLLNGGAIALGEGGTTTLKNLSGNSSASYFTGNFGLLGSTTLRTLAIDQSVDGTYAGSFEASTGGRTVSLVKQGAATLTFTNAANLYSGSTTVSAGTFVIGGAGRINNGAYAGAIDIASGATFQFDSTDSQTLSGAITNAGTFRKSSSGTLTLSGISSFGGTFAIDAGRVILTDNNTLTTALTVASGATLQVGNNTTAGTVGNGATIANSGAIEWNRSNDTNVSTEISGTGTLTKLGAGILSLNATNAISGTVTISAGTLRLGAGSTGGTIGTGDVVNNAALSFNRSNTLTLGNLVSGTGAVSQIGSGTTILTADNTYGGATTVSNGILQVGNGGTTGSLGSGNVTNNAALEFNRSNAHSVGNVISGTGSLTQSGNGTLTLTAVNTYSGATNIGAGKILEIGGSGTLASSPIAVDGTLNVNSTADFTLGGALTGSGLLSKSNTGNLTIGSENAAFAGSATVSGGKLVLGNANALGGRAVTVSSGGTLDLGDLAVTSAITLAGGTLEQRGNYTGILSTTGANTLNGVFGGTFVTGGTTTTTTGLTFAGTLKGTGTIDGDVTVTGAHTPGNSPGVQTITGDLTYSGGASTVQWELTTETSSGAQAGIAFDRIVVNGNLEFSAATALTLIFDGDGSDVNWTDAFWNNARSWLVYDVGGTTTSFSNLSLTDTIAYADGKIISRNVEDSTGASLVSVRADAGFYLGQQGADVRLYYRAVPEPSTYGLILGALALAGAAIRRRKQAK